MAVKFDDDFERDNWRQVLKDWKLDLPPTIQDPEADILPWWIHPGKQQVPSGMPPEPRPAIQGYPSWVDPQALPMFPNLSPLQINSAPTDAGPVTDMAPVGSAGGLLGMLYEMMRQGPKPDGGSSSNPQDAPPLASLERRLGSRTYRP